MQEIKRLWMTIEGLKGPHHFWTEVKIQRKPHITTSFRQTQDIILKMRENDRL